MVVPIKKVIGGDRGRIRGQHVVREIQIPRVVRRLIGVFEQSIK